MAVGFVIASLLLLFCLRDRGQKKKETQLPKTTRSVNVRDGGMVILTAYGASIATTAAIGDGSGFNVEALVVVVVVVALEREREKGTVAVRKELSPSLLLLFSVTVVDAPSRRRYWSQSPSSVTVGVSPRRRGSLPSSSQAFSSSDQFVEI
ncbi:hypothetical protein Ddye_013094 [Dipteronia dyeriana]|uniref:Uncharacterized protein n=1 Tax=Dipteronia dyeriana TaxID=168575 RepID=A0AAD9X5I6_9ROSI|nr:hypothetical protein Ddye_013094 [Dipteronia dyeriana]